MKRVFNDKCSSELIIILRIVFIKNFPYSLKYTLTYSLLHNNNHGHRYIILHTCICLNEITVLAFYLVILVPIFRIEILTY